MSSAHVCRRVSQNLLCTQQQLFKLLNWRLTWTYLSKTRCFHHVTHRQNNYIASNKSCISMYFSTHQLLRTPVKAHKSSVSGKVNAKKEAVTMTPRPIVKITLHESDGRVVGAMTKQEAQRIAKQRNLKLVLVQNPDASSTEKEMYKLLTGAELYEEQMKEKLVKKEQEPEERDSKTLILSSKISSHDIETRVKALRKWLKKRHSVCVTILSSSKDSSESNMEEIVKAIESSLEGVGVVQHKRAKDNVMKFTIQPAKTEDSSP